MCTVGTRVGATVGRGARGGGDVMGDVCSPRGAQTEHALREVCAQRGGACGVRDAACPISTG